MKPRAGSLAARLINVSFLWIVLALGAAVFVLSGLYRDHVETELAERVEGYLDELSAALDVTPAGDLILQRDLSDPLFRRPFAGLYWEVTVAGRELHRSRSLWDQSLGSPKGGTQDTPAAQPGPEGQRLLVWTRTIRYPGFAEPITLRVAANGARVENMAASFTRTLAISLAILAAGLIGLVIAQVRFGLAPLRRLGHAITGLREGQVDRIEGSYPSEIRPLVEDLNAVLHENRELLARARAQAGNLAHALKTPLAVIRNALGTPGSGSASAPVLVEVERMHAAIERHLVRARAGAPALSARHVLVKPALDDVIRAVTRIHGHRVDISVSGPESLRFRGDVADLQEILGNLLDNAAKWARSAVSVDLSTSGESLRIVLHDDGPGIPADRRADAMKRGVRLDTTRPGSGLGLQIVDELCSIYGGNLELGDSPLGGLAAMVTLPGR